MNGFSKDTQIKAFKIAADKKRVLLSDLASKNLFVNVTQTSKAFLFIYTDRATKKQKSITIGKYPSTSLALARQKADELRAMLECGLSPKDEIKRAELSFESVAQMYLKEQEKRGLATFEKSIKGRVLNHLLPKLAHKKIKDLKRSELIEVIRNLELKDKRGDGYETKAKTFGILKNILKFVSIEGLLDDYISPLADLEFSDFFKDKHEVNHHRYISDHGELKEFLRAVDGYKNELVKSALKFGIYTALRSANVRLLKWDYVDFSKNIITIPAKEMKMKKPFVLPMSKQVAQILNKMKDFRQSELVFSTNGKALSDNTLNAAIKNLGFGKSQDFHGLRGLFSTNLNELIPTHKISAEIIELCLAHSDKNEVREAYNHSIRLAEKAELMSFWADFIDEIKAY